MAYGPWKLIRHVLRIVLFAVLAWFILALLWAFLPSPPLDHNPDNGIVYATSTLRAGRALIRVYDYSHFPIPDNDRRGFAIDYKLDLDNLTLTIGGSERQLPIVIPSLVAGTLTERVNATARIGDYDGANLPWFPRADAVLLFWWIHKEDLTFLLDVTWTMEGKDERDIVRRMEIWVAGTYHEQPLLALEIPGSDVSSLVVRAPESPLSSSPSMTYPIRVAIIHVIAPIAVFVNDHLGSFVAQVFQSFFATLLILLAVAAYGFLALAIVFSIRGCLGCAPFEVVVERAQARLELLRESQRLRSLPLEAFQERLDRLCRNERFKSVVEVCRNGWHPEREAARRAEVEVDVEKEAPALEEPSPQKNFLNQSGLRG